MARFHSTIAAVATALALVSSAGSAQQASMSLTHTVTVTVPPRVKVQVTPTANQQQIAAGRTGLAVNVNATRGWALVIGSKKSRATTQWVASNGERSSSMVMDRSHASKRLPEMGGASDSEPMMLTVVAP